MAGQVHRGVGPNQSIERGQFSVSKSDTEPPDHGRIETRKIWITTELNDYLNFPHVGQAFVIERHCIEKVRQVLS